MNQAPLLLISLCVGSALLLAGGVLWVLAGQMAPRSEFAESRPSRKTLGVWIVFAIAAVSSFSQCYLAFLLFGVSLDTSEYRDTLAAVLLIGGVLNTLAVGFMILRRMRHSRVAGEDGPAAQGRPVLMFYSIVATLTMVVNASMFWMAFVYNRPFLNPDSAAVLFASIAAFIVGWIAVMYGEQRPDSLTGSVPGFRRSRLILRAVAIILIIWGAICWSWLGIIPGGLWLLVIWSTLAARSRAGELTSLWTLSIASRSHALRGPQVWQHMNRVQGTAQSRLKRLAVLLGDGEPLDLALQRCRVIPRGCSMEVQAALDADRLSEALQAAAARETRRFAQGPEITEAFSISYFALIINVIIFIVGFLMYYIIPKFKKIFEDFGTELPRLTILLIRISDEFVNYWYLFFPFLLPALFFAVWCDMQARFYGWRSLFERFVGAYWPRLRSPDLLRGLAWGIRGGRPLSESFAAMTLGHTALTTRHRLRAIAEQVRTGENPWAVLQQQGWLNTAECEALQRAQTVGNLPWVLDTLADAEEQRWERRMSYRLQILRPVLISVMGLVVAFIVIALFMPLVKLLNDLS